jgi:hypothetical protein
MTEETPEERLARYEFVIDAYVRELTALREENARLREGASAHATLQDIYRNRDLPESLRAKAAAAALVCEKPKLLPERAPLELTAESVEPLASLLERQRARCDRLLALSLEERSALIAGVGNENGGNGRDVD